MGTFLAIVIPLVLLALLAAWHADRYGQRGRTRRRGRHRRR